MGASNDLTDFGLGDMVRLASSLRAFAGQSAHLEDYAGQLCTFLHEAFVDDTGGRQAVLVRVYLTQPAAGLPATERAFVGDVDDQVRCLTLLGTAGESPEWNDRRLSQGHLVIPLHNADRIAELPMIAGLLAQMRVNVGALVAPPGLVLDPAEHRFGVFHVPDAWGSPLIPAQDFVREHGVRSVLGFGGVLPDGEIYTVVLFARVAVRREIAELLEALSPSITLAMTEMLDLPVFADRSGVRTSRVAERDRAQAREALLRGLLEVHERVAAQESDRARGAIAEARREAERSGNLARTLQASLLPHELPRISGLKSAAYFQPSGDGSEIGGDFYDVFPIRRGTWGLVLGDVSGKGAGAASLTALARHTVRAAALRTRSCIEVLRVLNEAVYRQEIAEERYLTAVFALLTRRGWVLEVDLCLGGHEPPLLLRPGQPAIEVGSIGQPLGLFPHPDISSTRFEMQRGESLITFTDGATEARRDQDFFGLQRVEATLAALSDRAISEIVDGLAGAVTAFQGPDASDDLAILGIQSTR
ncbi:MAG: protein serine phosphatase with GAF(s) sensor(s) [Frankiales bacterium]|nr:protein serine phosphatase with GAF(s) sensor(s) [Frankiales bacterium]